MTDHDGAASELWRFADLFVDEDASRDPIAATTMGIGGYDHLLPEFTPERWERDAAFTAGALATVRGIEPADEVDRVGKAVMVERLERRLELESSGELARTVSVIASPVSDIRQVFELMATDTDEGRDNVRARLAAVRSALEGWRRGLVHLAQLEQLPPRRHLLGIAEQARIYADGAFAAIATSLEEASKDPEALRAAGVDADAACGELASFILAELVAKATEVEACGPERHARWARNFTGAELDLGELYEWGWDDLSRINARMWELSEQLLPGARTLDEVANFLDADDDRAVFGVDEMLARLRSLTDDTVRALRGVHFEIDPRIERCDVRVAPEGSAAAPYYIEPSEDLSRPGTTWLPTLGRERFPLWRYVSTWYHEAVPGHHLQGATAMLAVDRLNRFQRQLAWTSGYGEGWALYAERLMEELGAFTDPGDELGYLEGQALRASRIVVDLGLHLGYRAPSDLGELRGLGDCSGRPWTPEMAVALLEERAIADPETAASEVDRYLGWPAQAISYKVGERAWLAARADAKQRLGERFDLKGFHSYALRLGPMGLDPFCAELARWDGR